jgi:crossover junction endodeoxyribonuclease RuvC
MSLIIGIDLSLTATGLAAISIDKITTVKTHVVPSSGSTDDSIQERFDRQTELCSAIMDWVLDNRSVDTDVDRPDLVVIEALFNSKTSAGGLLDRSGLWWRVVGSLLCWGIPVVSPTQSQGKKFFTGNGSADKGAMAMYAARLYPQWNPATMKHANDEADAIAMASIGVGLWESDTSWPYPNTDYRQKIIDDLDKKQFRGKKAA